MEWIKISDKLPPFGEGVLILIVTKLSGIEKPIYWATFGRFTLENGLSIPETKTGYISEYEEFLSWALIPLPDQPERSKREDSQECEMRCSEHCGDTVRDK